VTDKTGWKAPPDLVELDLAFGAVLSVTAQLEQLGQRPADSAVEVQRRRDRAFSAERANWQRNRGMRKVATGPRCLCGLVRKKITEHLCPQYVMDCLDHARLFAGGRTRILVAHNYGPDERTIRRYVNEFAAHTGVEVDYQIGAVDAWWYPMTDAVPVEFRVSR
jgi:hypothetical protein